MEWWIALANSEMWRAFANLDWWRALEIAASLGVAGGTVLLAVKTAKMAEKAGESVEVSARQLDWYREQDLEAKRPKLFFFRVHVHPQHALNADGETVIAGLSFFASFLANLGAHAIVVDSLQVADDYGNILARGRLSRVIPGGTTWPSPVAADGGQNEPLALAPMYGAKEADVDRVALEAAFLELRFRSGSDSRRRWGLRMPKAEGQGLWLAFYGRDSEVFELSEEAE